MTRAKISPRKSGYGTTVTYAMWNSADGRAKVQDLIETSTQSLIASGIPEELITELIELKDLFLHASQTVWNNTKLGVVVMKYLVTGQLLRTFRRRHQRSRTSLLHKSPIVLRNQSPEPSGYFRNLPPTLRHFPNPLSGTSSTFGTISDSNTFPPSLTQRSYSQLA